MHIDLKTKMKVLQEYTSKTLRVKDIWEANAIWVRSLFNIIHECKSINETSSLNERNDCRKRLLKEKVKVNAQKFDNQRVPFSSNNILKEISKDDNTEATISLSVRYSRKI